MSIRELWLVCQQARPALLRAALAVVVLLAVGLISYKSSQNSLDLLDMSFLLAGIVAVVAGVALYRLGRFEHGLLAIALTAGLANFFTLPTGRDSRVVISLALTLLLLLVWGLQLLHNRQSGERLAPSVLNKPLLAFVAVNFVAYIWGVLMRDPLLYVWPSFPTVQAAALAVNIALPLLALMVANKIKDVKWLRYLSWIVIVIGAVSIVSEYLKLPIYQMTINGTRGTFAMWLSAIACAFAIYGVGLPKWQRVALILLVGLWFYRNFVTGALWLSGWMPMAIACGIVVALRSRKLLAVIAVVVLAFLALNFDKYYNLIVVGNEEEGSLSRFEIWSMNLQHVVNHPIFGMGPAGYAPYNMTYHAEDARSTHNNYFDVLAQTGIVGFAIFLALLGAFLHIAVQNVRMTNGQHTFEAAFSAVALGGCLGAIVAMMLGDWVIPFAYNQTITGFDNAAYTWMLLGGAVSLNLILHKRRATTPTQ